MIGIQILQEIDPIGRALRRSHAIRRSVYSVQTPNELWYVAYVWQVYSYVITSPFRSLSLRRTPRWGPSAAAMRIGISSDRWCASVQTPHRWRDRCVRNPLFRDGEHQGTGKMLKVRLCQQPKEFSSGPLRFNAHQLPCLKANRKEL